MKLILEVFSVKHFFASQAIPNFHYIHVPFNAGSTVFLSLFGMITKT